MSDDTWSGGLPPELDYMLPEKPQDPEMRESASFWLFEDSGALVVPAWVQDYRKEKLAGMSDREKADAGSMGYGYRIEQLFRAQGTLRVDGVTRDFKAVGSRIHRQSVRPMAAFRGHCWQSAVFPD